AGDHERTDAGILRARNGLRGFGARRIDHADETEEDQVLFDRLVDSLRTERIARQQAQRDPERAHALPREIVDRLAYLLAALRRQRDLLLADFFLRAACKQDIRRAFREREQEFLALRIAVNRAHQLALGGERQLRETLEARAHLVREPRLARGDD